MQQNKITTSKYTVVTFLPKNMFEQLQRLANAYFFGLLILQVSVVGVRFLMVVVVTDSRGGGTSALLEYV